MSVLISDIPMQIYEDTSVRFTVSLSQDPESPFRLSIYANNDFVQINENRESVLNFDSGNYFIPQTVKIKVLKDLNIENESFFIFIENIERFYSKKIPMQVIDTDVQSIVIIGDQFIQEGSIGKIYVSLSQEPASSVVIDFSSPQSSLINLSANQFIFNAKNYSTPQEITVSLLEDANDFSEKISIEAVSPSIGKKVYDIYTIENDTTVVFSGNNAVAEGRTAQLKVKLSGNPGKNIFITVSSSDTGRIVLENNNLNFTPENYNVEHIVTMNGFADADANDNALTITASGKGIVSKEAIVYLYELRNIISVLPADNSVRFNPSQGKIKIVFDQTMDISIVPDMIIKINNAFVSAKGSQFTRSKTVYNNDTLEIQFPWLYFPELTTISWKADTNLSYSTDYYKFSTSFNNMRYPLLSSGQTECWDSAGNIINCLNSGHDGEFSSRYLERKFTLEAVSSAYNNDMVIKDNSLGFVWSNKITETYIWFRALNACSPLNNMNSGAGYAGIKTWRLPTLLEISSITNFGSYAPSVDYNLFELLDGLSLWTATARETATGTAFFLDIVFGVDSTIYLTTE